MKCIRCFLTQNLFSEPIETLHFVSEFLLMYVKVFKRMTIKLIWRRAQQSTPAFLPGESHGQKSLVGYSPWGCKELDVSEAIQHTSNSQQVYLLETERGQKVWRCGQMEVLNLIIFFLKIRDAYIMCEFFQNIHTSKVRRKYKNY